MRSAFFVGFGETISVVYIHMHFCDNDKPHLFLSFKYRETANT